MRHARPFWLKCSASLLGTGQSVQNVSRDLGPEPGPENRASRRPRPLSQTAPTSHFSRTPLSGTMRFRERVIWKLCICSFRLAHRGCSHEAAAAPMFSQPMGNVLRLGGPGVPERNAPELRVDLLAPDAPAQQLQRASPVGHLATALLHGLTQARLRWLWAFKVVKRIRRLRKLWHALGTFLKGMTEIKPRCSQLVSTSSERRRPAR